MSAARELHLYYKHAQEEPNEFCLYIDRRVDELAPALSPLEYHDNIKRVLHLRTLDRPTTRFQSSLTLCYRGVEDIGVTYGHIGWIMSRNLDGVSSVFLHRSVHDMTPLSLTAYTKYFRLQVTSIRLPSAYVDRTFSELTGPLE